MRFLAAALLVTPTIAAAATGDYRMHSKSAIRWLKSHAGELGIDPERIVAGGSSAGGHIAVLAVLNRRGLDDQHAAVRSCVAPGKEHTFWGQEPWHGLYLAECDALLVSLGLLEGPVPQLSAAGGERLTEVR